MAEPLASELPPGIESFGSAVIDHASSDDPNPPEFPPDDAAEARAYKKKKRRKRRSRAGSAASSTSTSYASESEDESPASASTSPRNARTQKVVALERTLSMAVWRR
jgi:hypothetical protein